MCIHETSDRLAGPLDLDLAPDAIPWLTYRPHDLRWVTGRYRGLWTEGMAPHEGP